MNKVNTLILIIVYSLLFNSKKILKKNNIVINSFKNNMFDTDLLLNSFNNLFNYFDISSNSIIYKINMIFKILEIKLLDVWNEDKPIFKFIFYKIFKFKIDNAYYILKCYKKNNGYKHNNFLNDSIINIKLNNLDNIAKYITNIYLNSNFCSLHNYYQNDLFYYLKNKKIKKWNSIYVKLLTTLEWMHTNGIYSINIKPDNILINKEQGKLIPYLTNFNGSVDINSELIIDNICTPHYFPLHIIKKLNTKDKNMLKFIDNYSLSLIFIEYYFKKNLNWSEFNAHYYIITNIDYNKNETTYKSNYKVYINYILNQLKKIKKKSKILNNIYNIISGKTYIK